MATGIYTIISNYIDIDTDLQISDSNTTKSDDTYPTQPYEIINIDNYEFYYYVLLSVEDNTYTYNIYYTSTESSINTYISRSGLRQLIQNIKNKLNSKLNSNSNNYIKSISTIENSKNLLLTKGNGTTQTLAIWENFVRTYCTVLLASGTVITDGLEIELEKGLYYQYGKNSLKVYWNGVLLQNAVGNDDGHYIEVGTTSGDLSNAIKMHRTESDGDYTLTEDVYLTFEIFNT